MDLRGKHGRIRTVPVLAWVKAAVDVWREAAGLSGGRILRAMNRHGQIIGDRISGQAILDLAAGYSLALEVRLRPDDLRPSCAKLCRAAGGELAQIQLLGHFSIQTTERYLGTRQDLQNRLGLGWRG